MDPLDAVYFVSAGTINLSPGFLRDLKISLYNLYKSIDTELSMYTKFRYTH